MFFKQIAVEGMGCLSYFIGCMRTRSACVVDPKRDVEDYLNVAYQYGMEIDYIFETHIQEDHVSGNQELQARTEARIHMMEGTPVQFDLEEVRDGQVIRMGDIELSFIWTPGHTPYSMSILVTDRSRGPAPCAVLTGDCLLVGGVGRPDLAGDELMEEEISALYTSLHDRLCSLPADIEVCPAHGRGGLCAKALEAKTSSTLGYEMKCNPYLNLSYEEFEERLTQERYLHPRSLSHIIYNNMEGPALLETRSVRKAMTPEQVVACLARGAIILDTRDAASFAGIHIPGSVNIGSIRQSVTWTAILIEPSWEIILLCQDEKTYDNMCRRLHRIGYDHILGYIYGGIEAWQEKGAPISQLWQYMPKTLAKKIDNNDCGHIFDVRTIEEFEAGHLEKAELLALQDLFEEFPNVPYEDEIVIICGVGYRGNMAASFLQRNGFKKVRGLAGGMKAWRNQGYPTVT